MPKQTKKAQQPTKEEARVQAQAIWAKYLERKAYREAMNEVERFLGFAFFRLDELKSDLAIEGSHKSWADAQGPGLFLDDLDYQKSDDPTVRDLATLHALLKEVYDRLPVKPGAPAEPRSALH